MVDGFEGVQAQIRILVYNSVLAHLHLVRGQYDMAIAQHKHAMDLDPGWYFPHWALVLAHAHVGRLEEAIAEAQKACELSGRNAITLGFLALAYGLASQRSEARALLEELMAPVAPQKILDKCVIL